MDFFDEVILKVLGREKRGKELRGVVEETGFARSTVVIHLRRLEAGRLVRRKKIIRKGRGRPKYHYVLKTFSSGWGLPTDTDNIVQIEFRRLRHACGFEKGRFCKKATKRCAPTHCPLTKKQIKSIKVRII